ncbi:MAG: ThuA domain-containing protein [Aureliella sp.]
MHLAEIATAAHDSSAQAILIDYNRSTTFVNLRTHAISEDSMTTIKRSFFRAGISLSLTILFCSVAFSQNADAKRRKVVVVAGKPSHPPRMHEFNAGVLLIEKCLRKSPLVDCQVVLNGWPKDESIFDSADAIVFYMDGGKRHEIVQEDGRRLELLSKLADKGVGLGFMHYGVEVLAEQAGEEMTKWIGGHYEHMFSCNPMWAPQFDDLPEHPITRGVKPFGVKDEWYINMRFAGGNDGIESGKLGELRFTPILVAKPSDEVRDGPYVYPPGPYKHIQAEKGQPEAVMWAVEAESGRRGFGFTGGHYHDNWANDDYRKVVLNALVWLAGAEVPASGIESKLADGDIDRNLDPKKRR